MRRRTAISGATAAFILVATAGGCFYTEKTKIIPPIAASFKGEYRFDPSLLDRPPQTVAVLPFLNRTDQKEAFDIVRCSFHGHFSKLNYTPLPLFKVDHALSQAGLDTPEKVAQASPIKLREILQVDAIIRGEVTHYERVYVGVYSQVAVGAEVWMLDGKTAKELWWAKDVSRKHGGGISTTPVGLILTAVATAFNVRQIELLRSSDDLFRDMVKTIPQPPLAQALRPPSISILAHDGMRRPDKHAQRLGDMIKVAMEGDPRKKAYFRIGDFKKEIPMREEEPGTYTGVYKVMPGDFVEDALIVGTLIDDAGNSTEWADVLGLVTIDTIPPGIPQDVKATGRDRMVQLKWAKNLDKDLAKYKIYRSNTPLTGYQEIGTTELANFLDQNLENGKVYYYKISALDLATNESQLSDFIQVTPVAPGPTSVKGPIQEDTTWYAGASPYILEGEVTVNPGATLSIEPGTTVRSKGEALSIQGRLIARGDRNGLITFEGALPDQNWKGLIFQGTKEEENAVEYAKITGALTAITCLSSSPFIAYDDISNNQVGIQVSESFSKPRIYGNVISSNSIAGIRIWAGAAPLLEENEIRGNHRDGVMIRGARPFLERNRIFNNGEVGVRLSSSAATLLNNNIHDNGQYEVYNSLEKDVPVEAKDNWWGTREGRKLIRKIFGRVDYQRILDAPYPQGKPLELPILKGPLGGSIDRDSFLTLANAPYVLEKEMSVEKGATLFIEPGVTLKYNPGASIVVKDGGIDARGTPERVIVFTSNSSSPSPGSYPSAVRFERPSKLASFFRFCIIEYAETGLDISFGAPEIDHCFIARHSQAGLKVANDAEPKIFFSTLAKNMGTGAVVVLGTARPRISRNNFQENPFAIQSFSPIYLDARRNWWGGSPPPESLFLGQINMKPWLEQPEPEAFTGRKP